MQPQPFHEDWNELARVHDGRRFVPGRTVVHRLTDCRSNFSLRRLRELIPFGAVTRRRFKRTIEIREPRVVDRDTIGVNSQWYLRVAAPELECTYTGWWVVEDPSGRRE